MIIGLIGMRFIVLCAPKIDVYSGFVNEFNFNLEFLKD
jgi:hypothetical protein